MSSNQSSVVFDDVQVATIALKGYGSAVFLECLQACFERLARRRIRDEEIEQITTLAADVVEHRIVLIPGVVDTFEFAKEQWIPY
jgi:hypothetical protein